MSTNVTRVASFDVFDTVLSRVVASPTGLFLLLGRQAAAESLAPTPEVFARVRLAAEERALAHFGARTTTEAIYEEVAHTLQLDGPATARLMAMEFALEHHVVRTLPRMVDVVTGARSAGDHVVYMSDMHLPRPVIEAVLTEQGALRDTDELYVSSHSGRAKWSGDLFRAMLEAQAVRPDQVRHIGNDRQADVDAPRKLGISAIHHAAGNLNRYEQLLDRHAFATGGLSSVFAGCSRLARTSIDARTSVERAVRDVSCGVVAPMLTGYVLWVLARARRLGISRLYFAARDGQVMLQIAERLAPHLDLRSGVRLQYLHVSRQAVSLAARWGTDDDDLRWLVDPVGVTSLHVMAHQMGLTIEDLRPVLCRLGHSGGTADLDLSVAERFAVIEAIGRDCRLGGRVRAHATDQRRLLTAYLRQVGLTGSGVVGLVDLGWRGTTQHALEQLIGESADAELHGLYSGADPPLHPDYEPRRREAYMFDNRLGIGFSDFPEAHRTLFEIFCSGDHGPVLGYEGSDAAVRPVVKGPANDAALAWGLPLLRASVAAFVDALPLELGLLDLGADVRPATSEVLRTFLAAPSRVEAEAWSAFPLEVDSAGLHTVPFGALAHGRDVGAALRRGGWERHHPLSWEQGSLAVSAPYVRSTLLGLHRGKAIVARASRAAARSLRRGAPR